MPRSEYIVSLVYVRTLMQKLTCSSAVLRCLITKEDQLCSYVRIQLPPVPPPAQPRNATQHSWPTRWWRMLTLSTIWPALSTTDNTCFSRLFRLPGRRRGGGVSEQHVPLWPIRCYPSCWRASRAASSGKGPCVRQLRALVGWICCNAPERMAAPGPNRCTASLPKGVTSMSWHGHMRTVAVWKETPVILLLVRGI